MPVSLSRVLILVGLFAFLSSCSEGTPKSPPQETSASRISNLKAAISQESYLADRFKVIENLKQQVSEESLQSETLAAENRIDQLQMKAGLELLPTIGEFEPARCAEYKAKIKTQLDPLSVDATVQKILEILTLLCE